MSMNNLQTDHLKEIDSSSGKYSNRELKINGMEIFYHKELEVFLLRLPNGKVKASKEDIDYNYLRDHKSIYKFLLDLGVDYKVINEIFLTNRNDYHNAPIVFVHIFAKRFQESIDFDKTDFNTEENVKFLDELESNPTMMLTEHYNKYFTEEFKEIGNNIPIAFSNRDDGNAVSYFADADYSDSENKIYINTVVSYTSKKADNAMKVMNNF